MVHSMMKKPGMLALVVAGGVLAATLGGVAWLKGAKSSVEAPAVSSVTLSESKPYTVDSGHSSVVYRITHMGVANFYGRFNEMSGSFHIDSADLSGSMIKVNIKSESIDSNSSKRDEHLKSADFFSVNEHDTISFVSTGFKKSSDTMYEVSGDLTLLGKSKPVTAMVEVTGEKKTPRGELAGIEAKFSIKRSDFGMNYGVDNGALGDEVAITVALEGKR
jgi:polyisoprenoid-binding protein YceI